MPYFAWVRERGGVAEEEIDQPPTVPTVGDLISWLYPARFAGSPAADRGGARDCRASHRRHWLPERIRLAEQILDQARADSSPAIGRDQMELAQIKPANEPGDLARSRTSNRGA